MNKQQIGDSSLYVSEIGLGCMSLGTDEENAKKIIDTAISNEINYLDTADLYDQGVNEELIGKAIKGKRNDVILATKVGNRFERGKDGWEWDPSKTYIKSAVKESLRRLQTDYIDLYQLHGGTIDDPIDEIIEAFEELKEEGIIRYYGISSIRPNVIKQFCKQSSIISVMMQYSILDRRPEELFTFLKEHNVSVLARGPVAKGILTDKSSNRLGKDYLSYSSQELKNISSSIKNISNKHSLTSTALHYCLHDEVVAAAVVGASSIEQIEKNINAINTLTLADDELNKIKEISKASLYEQHR
ncbi:aldo/keto reductase [Bacillus sp. FJAT-45350]|uniref:aldo/keto reductase n=1 Tax=Bacillus sp. FJAT-45350 TaxID=2011014 RepID=UPI000BB6E232|nr:aldo/keto reductase [Bacillus sp. FJAT-45350]